VHPDYLPTGNPVIGHRRAFGTLPEADRLGIGIVGLHEGHTLLVALRASQMCRPVAGCDLSEEKRRSAEAACPGLRTTADYSELLENEAVDIVAIYTPDALHADQIRQAFEAGKHVICTKPLINDIAAIPGLLEAARSSGRRLQVGQSTRFYEPFLRQREQYESGKLGRIEAVDAHYHHRMDWYYEKSPWTIDTTHWAYLGLSHPVDLVRWYLGDIEAVQAVGTRSSLALEHGLRTPDVIAANLIGANGQIGRAFGHYGIHELDRARSLIECFLMGDAGSSLARYPDLRFSYHDENGTEVEEDFHHSMAGYYYRHELKGMHYGEFCNYTDYFAAALTSGVPNSPNLEEGLQTVLVMNALVEALDSGGTVPVRRISEIEG